MSIAVSGENQSEIKSVVGIEDQTDVIEGHCAARLQKSIS